MRILFVCGRNRRRSPTAERLFRNDPRVEARSAGVSEKSDRQVKAADLQWADLILVMERRYGRRIRERFREMEALPPIKCLEVPDDYEFMDEELVEMIREGTEGFLEES